MLSPETTKTRNFFLPSLSASYGSIGTEERFCYRREDHHLLDTHSWLYYNPQKGIEKMGFFSFFLYTVQQTQNAIEWDFHCCKSSSQGDFFERTRERDKERGEETTNLIYGHSPNCIMKSRQSTLSIPRAFVCGNHKAAQLTLQPFHPRTWPLPADAFVHWYERWTFFSRHAFFASSSEHFPGYCPFSREGHARKSEGLSLSSFLLLSLLRSLISALMMRRYDEDDDELHEYFLSPPYSFLLQKRSSISSKETHATYETITYDAATETNSLLKPGSSIQEA